MKRLLTLSLLAMSVAASTHAMAWGWNDCDYEKEIDQTLDVSGSESLAVYAKAGDLKVVGSSTSDVRILGKACADSEADLAEADVETNGGKTAEIYVVLKPDSNSMLDLKLEVPDDLPLIIKDSSGDVELLSVASVNIQDSSGDIQFEDIRGDVVIESDSSGDIEGDNIAGAVLVKRDSSGDIEFSEVAKDFTVEKDSSGDIEAEDVGGNFTVIKDGSGDIDARDIAGKVSTPD